MMDYHNAPTLAAQAMAGLAWHAGQYLEVDTGYRFFWGGNFDSNHYLLLDNFGVDDMTPSVPSWSGHVIANEFFVNLDVYV